MGQSLLCLESYPNLCIPVCSVNNDLPSESRLIYSDYRCWQVDEAVSKTVQSLNLIHTTSANARYPSTLGQNDMVTVTTLPKEISKLGQEIKLFGKWDTQE